MFILPLPETPGEHRTDDHVGGLIERARRWFHLNVRMGVNGFIRCALLIQAFSIAGIMPTQVWIAQPGYALIVCFGLVTISACILFSLKSLLTQSSQERTAEADVLVTGNESPSQPINMQAASQEASASVALVVQNNRTLQTIIQKSLAIGGIQSVCVSDGAAAKQALETDKFDLLIVEFGLEERSRSAATPDVRELCRSKGIPLLALTAEKTAGRAQTQADATMAMPIVPRELAGAALDLIARGSLDAASGSPQSSAAAREAPKLESEPLDPRALGDLEKLGGGDFVRDIVAQFVADAAAVLGSLGAAVTSRDEKAFREQAHALRSCAANVGAQNVYRMCLAWRDLDAKEIAASGSEYMRMLEEEFERVRGALTPMLQQGDDRPTPDSKTPEAA